MSDKFPAQNHIRMVSTFSELVGTRFTGETNAICWKRDLQGNFAEIVAKLTLLQDITEITPENLLALQLSEQGDLARKVLLSDMELLTGFGASPSLNLIRCYARDEDLDFISTDVYSYHVDKSPVETDTFLCTYHGAVGDILPNPQAEQLIVVPEIRSKLEEIYEGPKAEFDNFLKEYFFDLHYSAKDNAEPTNLGLGQLWKLAVDHPGQSVLPCIHRAPLENEGEYRLLLIC